MLHPGFLDFTQSIFAQITTPNMLLIINSALYDFCAACHFSFFPASMGIHIASIAILYSSRFELINTIKLL